MKEVLISRFKKTFHLDDLDVEMCLNEEDELCEYWIKCKKNCFADKPCAIKRFYNKYPDYEFLGIGAATEPPRRRYEAN